MPQHAISTMSRRRSSSSSSVRRSNDLSMSAGRLALIVRRNQSSCQRHSCRPHCLLCGCRADILCLTHISSVRHAASVVNSLPYNADIISLPRACACSTCHCASAIVVRWTEKMKLRKIVKTQLNRRRNLSDLVAATAALISCCSAC